VFQTSIGQYVAWFDVLISDMPRVLPKGVIRNKILQTHHNYISSMQKK